MKKSLILILIYVILLNIPKFIPMRKILTWPEDYPILFLIVEAKPWYTMLLFVYPIVVCMVYIYNRFFAGSNIIKISVVLSLICAFIFVLFMEFGKSWLAIFMLYLMVIMFVAVWISAIITIIIRKVKDRKEH